MPRTLKRRSDAISQDNSPSPPQSRSPSRSPNGRDSTSPRPSTTLQTQIKKLVRLALSAEASRTPIRRAAITAFLEPRAFKPVFLGAQAQLRTVFGMELVDLPTRERTTVQDRRIAASKSQNTQKRNETQTQSQKDPILSAQSWILVSCLPEAYRHSVLSGGDEYTALYSLVVAVLYLHCPSEENPEPLSDAKLMRFLKRVDIENYVVVGERITIEKFLNRCVREGYIERRKNADMAEEAVEWVVGPRGKREIGRRGVAALVRGVYGFGVDGRGAGLELPGDREDGEGQGGGEERPARLKMERDELEQRLRRTLGDIVKLDIQEEVQSNDLQESQQQQQQQEETPRRSGRTR